MITLPSSLSWLDGPIEARSGRGRIHELDESIRGGHTGKPEVCPDDRRGQFIGGLKLISMSGDAVDSQPGIRAGQLHGEIHTDAFRVCDADHYEADRLVKAIEEDVGEA